MIGALASVALAGCGTLATKAASRGADSVTQWTLIADDYGNGKANWRTMAMMHMAMHDALNAARPIYSRWWPRTESEPASRGANPEVAMAAAAGEVLALLHPKRVAETEAALASCMDRYPDGSSKEAGIALGRAIGQAVVERRAGDGVADARLFEGGEDVGRWRPTPTSFATSKTNAIRPFLFASVSDVPTVPPLALGTPLYLEQLREVQSIGELHSSSRTPEQTQEAYFWAYQTSQRGFVELAVRLFAAQPGVGAPAEAKVMAELSAALADSAILTWNEKAQYSFWRPITAIRAGTDPTWTPLIETPPFPEYPSGHATDCYVGAAVLEAAFPNLPNPFVYRSSAFWEPLTTNSAPAEESIFGMGQHAQSSREKPQGGDKRLFPTLAAAADDCAVSRVWAGAHFSASVGESKRLASLIVHRALEATPAVSIDVAAARTRR
jgi:hypothetical protein